MSVQLVGLLESQCKDDALVYKVAAKLGKNNNNKFSSLSAISFLERSKLNRRGIFDHYSITTFVLTESNTWLKL